MDSPPYLVDQFAKMRGVNAVNAKRALMLTAYAESGKKLSEARRLLRISEDVARLVCRRFMIDFPDYRPYAALEAKGQPRPQPFVRQDRTPDGLPLFGAV
jgi:hypothetical protein